MRIYVSSATLTREKEGVTEIQGDTYTALAESENEVMRNHMISAAERFPSFAIGKITAAQIPDEMITFAAKIIDMEGAFDER